MHRRTLCTLLAATLVAGLFAVAAPSAQAAPPFASNNFNPQDDIIGLDGGAPGRLLLSDRFNGLNSFAHITSVATADTTQAIYVVCLTGTSSAGTGSVPRAGCTELGRDTSPTQTPLPPGFPPGAVGHHVFELFTTIPAAMNNEDRDFWGYHCVGAPTASEPGGNCSLEVEPDVRMSSSAAGGALPNAEFRDWCIGDSTIAPPGNPCTSTPLRPFDHFTVLPNLSEFTAPNNRLILRVRSSPDIDELVLCIDPEAHAEAAFNVCTLDSHNTTPSDSDATMKEWTYVITAATWAANAYDSRRMGWWVHNFGGGTGACDAGALADTCLLDVHHVVSLPRTPTTAISTWIPSDTTGEDAQGSTNCASPVKDITKTLSAGGNLHWDMVCIEDQAGDRMDDINVTFESTGPEGSGLTGCKTGGIAFVTGTGVANAVPTLHDHNGDGRFEHCHAATGTEAANTAPTNLPSAQSGVAFARANNFTGGPQTARPGTQNITVCRDTSTPFSGPVPPTAPPAGHGCANETVTDQQSLTWTTAPQHLHTIYSGTGDPADPAHSGELFRDMAVGDMQNITVFSFDTAHNPAPTAGTQWSIVPGIIPVVSGDPTGVRFVGTPPTNTSAPDGTADATFEAFALSNNFIGWSLRSPTGVTGPLAAVQAQVSRGAEIHDDARTIGLQRFRGPRLRPRRIIARGRVRVAPPNADHAECFANVPVRVQRRFLRGRGSDRFRTLRTITTGATGVYRTRLVRPRRAHRIRVVARPLTVGDHRCLRAVNSRRVVRRRR